ncbi:MAG: ketopantoate reductase family protein [Geminicoccaceae bacterium]
MTSDIFSGPARIAVLGAGSLGSVIGGRLAQAGNEVLLVNRNRDFVETVNAGGLVLVERGERETIALRAARDASNEEPFDLVIVLVKSFHTEEAMTASARLFGDDTIVLSLQNGVGHEDTLARFVPAGNLLAGKSWLGGLMTSPGVIEASATGRETVIGEPSGPVSERARAVAALFDAAGLATRVSANIRGVIWDKLLVNTATGALSGITRLDYGNLYDVGEITGIACAAVAEGMAVARALGIELSHAAPEDVWLSVKNGLAFNFKASILQSLEKGSITEIDHINGAIVREGARLGIPTPVNSTLVACIKGIERSLAPKSEADVRRGEEG